MIVLIAAGGTPNLSFNPAEAMQTMTAFIAAAGLGDQPTGSTGYKTIFAVGALLFIATFVMNIFCDPARAQVPGGLRMSTVAPSRSGSDRERVLGGLFRALLFVSLAVGIVDARLADPQHRRSRAGRA